MCKMSPAVGLHITGISVFVFYLFGFESMKYSLARACLSLIFVRIHVCCGAVLFLLDASSTAELV